MYSIKLTKGEKRSTIYCDCLCRRVVARRRVLALWSDNGVTPVDRHSNLVHDDAARCNCHTPTDRKGTRVSWSLHPMEAQSMVVGRLAIACTTYNSYGGHILSHARNALHHRKPNDDGIVRQNKCGTTQWQDYFTNDIHACPSGQWLYCRYHHQRPFCFW